MRNIREATCDRVRVPHAGPPYAPYAALDWIDSIVSS